MKITIITLFPDLMQVALSHSILGRAQKKGVVEFNIVDLRDFGIGKHKSVDDKPYGGGKGMILKVDVLDQAISHTKQYIKREKVILLCPQGKVYSQKQAENLSTLSHLILVSGHYEGFDERVRNLVDMEISVGDFILTGGEFPAMIIADSITRLLPGSISEGSAQMESLSLTDRGRLLEGPQFTRPEDYGGHTVPRVYLSGDPRKIEEFKIEEALKKTKTKRPDLLENT